MCGHNASRTFAYPCPTDIAPDTVERSAAGLVLQHRRRGHGHARRSSTAPRTWATGRDASTPSTPRPDSPAGRSRPTPSPNVYAGQIVSSAAVDRRRRHAGRVLRERTHAVRARHRRPASELWNHAVGTADPDDFTEIESSPGRGRRQGVRSASTCTTSPVTAPGSWRSTSRTGSEVWYFDAEQGNHHGCGDVWSSPSVDPDRGLVFAGSGNCPASPDGWGDYIEAMFALDLRPGSRAGTTSRTSPTTTTSTSPARPTCSAPTAATWSGSATRTAPTTPSTATAASSSGRPRPPEPGLDESGSNFSTGGFIGPTAYSDGIVAGGTAVGPAPYLHGIDAADGDILWQDSSVQAIYARAAIANGVLFQRRQRLHLPGLRPGHRRRALATRDEGRGGRRPGGRRRRRLRGGRHPRARLEGQSENSGVYRFSTPEAGRDLAPTSPRRRPRRPGLAATELTLEPTQQPCVARPATCSSRHHAARATGRPAADRSRSRSHRPVPGHGPRAPAWAAGSGSSRARPRPTRAPPRSACSSPRATTTRPAVCSASSTPTTRCTTDSLPRLTTYNRITLLALESARQPSAVGPRGRRPTDHHDVVQPAADPGRRQMRKGPSMYQASRPRRPSTIRARDDLRLRRRARRGLFEQRQELGQRSAGSSTTTSRPTGTTEATSEMAGGYTVFNGQGNNLDAYDPIPPFTTQRVITPSPTTPTASTSTPRSASSPTARTGSSPARTPARRRATAGLGHLPARGADRSATSAPRRSASWCRPTRAAPTTPRTTAAASCPTVASSPPTSATRRRATATASSSCGSRPSTASKIAYCKVDVGIATAQSIWVDDQDRVYVASARPRPSRPRACGATADLPTRPDRGRGCGKTDGTGAPLADDVRKEIFIPSGDNGLISPAGLARPAPAGCTCPACSPACINEYDADGHVRAHHPAAAGRREPGRQAVLHRHPARHRRRARRHALLRRHRHRDRRTTASARVTTPAPCAASPSSTDSRNHPRPWRPAWPSPTASGS